MLLSTTHVMLFDGVGVYVMDVFPLSSLCEGMKMLLEELTIKVIKTIVKKNVCNRFRLLVDNVFDLVILVIFL